MNCSRLLWVLQSFPTRRSSDLIHGGIQRAAHAIAAWSGDCAVAGVGKRAGGNDQVSAEPGQLDKPMIDQSIGNRQHTDRKSTRLTSSHRTSSYAVFFLKNKINV